MCVWTCAHTVLIETVWNTLELEIQSLVGCPTWLLETKLGSSLRVICALTAWPSVLHSRESLCLSSILFIDRFSHWIRLVSSLWYSSCLFPKYWDCNHYVLVKSCQISEMENGMEFSIFYEHIYISKQGGKTMSTALLCGSCSISSRAYVYIFVKEGSPRIFYTELTKPSVLSIWFRINLDLPKSFTELGEFPLSPTSAVTSW